MGRAGLSCESTWVVLERIFGVKCRHPAAGRGPAEAPTAVGEPLTPAAEQEHRLLAEQVPEPPRRSEPQRPAPGIERDGLLHLGSHHIAELAEVLDGAEVDV